MALKTNSKKAHENLFNYIRNYIIDELEEYGTTAESNKEISNFILDTFRAEKSGNYYKRFAPFEVFKDWAQGLALGGLFCYYYNRSAVDDVKEILEETEEEAHKFTEEQAEEFLTRYIFNTITKEAERR